MSAGTQAARRQLEQQRPGGDGRFRLYAESTAGEPWDIEEGGYGTLADAMAAAGRPRPVEWATASGVADFVFVEDPGAPRWVIHGQGAAAAYVALMMESHFGPCGTGCDQEGDAGDELG